MLRLIWRPFCVELWQRRIGRPHAGSGMAPEVSHLREHSVLWGPVTVLSQEPVMGCNSGMPSLQSPELQRREASARIVHLMPTRKRGAGSVTASGNPSLLAT